MTGNRGAGDRGGTDQYEGRQQNPALAVLGIDAELPPAVGAADEEPASDETLPCGDRELAASNATPVIEGM